MMQKVRGAPIIQLRLLGTLDLVDSGGQRLHSLLVQPKRIALLCYLTLAAPRGFCRRDRLLATFWPEVDDRHARAALRQATHVVRREVGDGAIRCRGIEEIGIDPAHLVCDALEFEEAIAAGRPADALALYHGPLLDGFYAPGLPEFECWIELLRARLEAKAAAAARTLTANAAASGNFELAVTWAQRAMEILPDDESVLRHLLTLLRRTGDRTGAIRAYERFARRLQSTYQLDPSDDVQSIARGLRSSSTQDGWHRGITSAEYGRTPGQRAPGPAGD
jgi:DNA-binding SARP family transcriptional activator